MPYKYSTKTPEKHAKAVGRSLEISFKQAVILCHHVRGMQVNKAIAFLERVQEMQEPVSHFRYAHNIGHRRGKKGPARYPIKAASRVLEIIKSAESNATSAGLAKDRLYIKGVVAQKASKTMKGGRHRGQAKRTHVEAVICEAVGQSGSGGEAVGQSDSGSGAARQSSGGAGHDFKQTHKPWQKKKGADKK